MPDTDSQRITVSRVLLVIATGVGAGFLSGLFGVGGGLVIVPALMAVLGMDQRLMAKNGPDPARIEADRQMLAEAVDNRREFLRLTSIAEQQQDVTDAVSRLAQAH